MITEERLKEIDDYLYLPLDRQDVSRSSHAIMDLVAEVRRLQEVLDKADGLISQAYVAIGQNDEEAASKASEAGAVCREACAAPE